MSDHKIGTREEWLAARLELLEAEKALTRRGDELARRRQELPWVRMDKEYRFETDEGTASLADLFRGRSQLLIYHFMFGPDYAAGCPSCSAIADGFNGSVVHLANHDVTLCAVSRAPLAKLQAYKRRMGWSPGVSHQGAVAVGSRRVQLPRGGPTSARGQRGESVHRRPHVERWDRLADVQARRARRERVRARGRRRVPHLLGVRAGDRRPVEHVPVARPRPTRSQRDGLVVAPPRRVQPQVNLSRVLFNVESSHRWRHRSS